MKPLIITKDTISFENVSYIFDDDIFNLKFWNYIKNDIQKILSGSSINKEMWIVKTINDKIISYFNNYFKYCSNPDDFTFSCLDDELPFIDGTNHVYILHILRDKIRGYYERNM